MIRTKACEVLGITQPVVLAPMGNTGGPKLVAAVSEAGGLGILACTWRGVDATRRDIAEVRRLTNRPFGVNFVLHLTDPQAFEDCLAQDVPVFSFFRGDPAVATARAHSAGAKVVCQVTTMAETAQATQIGCDVVIAQGVEAGGHMGPLPLWSFLPVVVAACGEVPILAAGGLVDGRDLAAALSFGAAGVVMGTRFLATDESAASAGHKRAILRARLGDTVDSGVWDVLWGDDWPGVKVRALRNAVTERWHGREDELLRVIEVVRAENRIAEAEDDETRAPYLMGVGASRISSILSAGQVVRDVVAEAENILRASNALIG